MHAVVLFFALSLCIPLSPINLLFMLCLPQKFLPHHVCKTLNSAYTACLLPMGTRCTGEFHYYTLQSCQFSRWLLHTRCPVQQCRNGSAAGADRTDTAPVQSKVTFYTTSVGMFKGSFFTGVSNQTAVVLWGQTEINDGHDPINVCVISKLNSWQIKTDWVIFCHLHISPSERPLLTGQIMFTNSWGMRHRGEESKMRQPHV